MNDADRQALADKDIYIHPTAQIDEDDWPLADRIGAGVKIWGGCHLRPGSRIGDRCVLGDGVYVGVDVEIGHGCKIQNHVSVFRGVRLEDDVFVGPSATFTNVLRPRAFITCPVSDYKPTLVRKGASIGANATIVCGVEIGKFAMIGAGAVVTEDVDAYALMVGVPARCIEYVCECGHRLGREGACGSLEFPCTRCHRVYFHNPDTQLIERT